MNDIDPRGPRFGAAITSVMLILALLIPLPGGLVAALVQWAAFGLGAFVGLQYQPWGAIYRRLVRPRLGAPKEMENPQAPRFAQTVGFAFLTVALIGWLIGFDVVYYVAVGGALLAALLNAVFDFCLGCEMYVWLQRVRRRPVGPLRRPV